MKKCAEEVFYQRKTVKAGRVEMLGEQMKTLQNIVKAKGFQEMSKPGSSILVVFSKKRNDKKDENTDR